jgi:hypothetical protein
MRKLAVKLGLNLGVDRADRDALTVTDAATLYRSLRVQQEARKSAATNDDGNAQMSFPHVLTTRGMVPAVSRPGERAPWDTDDRQWSDVQ